MHTFISQDEPEALRTYPGLRVGHFKTGRPGTIYSFENQRKCDILFDDGSWERRWRPGAREPDPKRLSPVSDHALNE